MALPFDALLVVHSQFCHNSDLQHEGRVALSGLVQYHYLIGAQDIGLSGADLEGAAR